MVKFSYNDETTIMCKHWNGETTFEGKVFRTCHVSDNTQSYLVPSMPANKIGRAHV